MSANLNLAIDRLERLIAKTRDKMHKPVGIGEVLHRHRTQPGIDLGDLETYRRNSYRWLQEVAPSLHNQPVVLNSRYWDQVFDPSILPPELMAELGELNTKTKGGVEEFIYWHVLDKYSSLRSIAQKLSHATTTSFDLSEFIQSFEADDRLKRSVDKAYEIIVHALFDTIVQALEATVTLSINMSRMDLLKEFQDFAKLVLGITPEKPRVRHPARLFRVGGTNAADGGLDMWANFGPAVQVKHVALSGDQVNSICGSIESAKIVVVCKAAERKSIDRVVKTLGFGDRIQGIITEQELVCWYQKCLNEEHGDALGDPLLAALSAEMGVEFPLADAELTAKFMSERGYSCTAKPALR